MKKNILLRSLAIVLGACGGFAYYYYIGCASGTCAITSNPWISTMYGALLGWLIVPKQKAKELNDELRNTQNN